jgi:hypothetical protein
MKKYVLVPIAEYQSSPPTKKLFCEQSDAGSNKSVSRSVEEAEGDTSHQLKVSKEKPVSRNHAIKSTSKYWLSN